MTTTELLATFSNSDLISTLSMGNKFAASLITTVLGMGITFTALIILLFIISWMDKILNRVPVAANIPVIATETTRETSPVKAEIITDDKEIIAAITSAIAMTLKTSTSNIVIKNIEKIETTTPAWNRTGIIEQMNSRL